MGFKAVRVQSGVPGLAATYGIAKGPGRYEPAERGLPSEYEWSTEMYLRHVPKLFARVRETFGEEIYLLHDCHHRLTPSRQRGWARNWSRFICSGWKIPHRRSYRKASGSFAKHTTTPIAVGEVFNTIWDAHELIRNQWIDYIRMTPVHSGGLTHLKKVADFAELYHVRTGCHGATDMSPVTIAAALHLGTAVHNFGIQR